MHWVYPSRAQSCGPHPNVQYKMLYFLHWIGSGVDFEVCSMWCSFLWFWGVRSVVFLFFDTRNCLLRCCSPYSDFDLFLPQTEKKKKIDRTEKEGLVECQSSFFYGLGTTTSPTMAYDWGIKRIPVGRVLLMDYILLGDTDSVYKFLIFLTWVIRNRWKAPEGIKRMQI